MNPELQNDEESLLRNSNHIISDNRGYDSLENPIYTDQPSVDIINGKPKHILQFVAALTASLSALAAGTVLGWTSPILTELRTGKFHDIPVNSDQMGWIGSFLTLGAMTMCIPTGFICDLIGRKSMLMILVIPFTIGWLLIIFSTNIIMLYFGRIITGIAAGACCVVVPLYTNEIASKDVRGTLGTYFQLMVCFGIVLAYSTGKYLNSMEYTILCATIPLFFVLFFCFQPESPVYLMKRGYFERARHSLLQLRGNSYNINEELLEIEGTLKERSEVAVSLRQTFRKKSFRKALIISLFLMFIQQFCGINAIILYTSDIFNSAKVDLDANTASIIVGAFGAVATLISTMIVDKLGRRILLMISSSVVGLSAFMLAFYFSLSTRSKIDISNMGFMPVTAVCLFMAVFSVGLGPIPWMISAEVFSPEIKSVASSVAGTFNWFLAFLVTKFYLQVKEMIGQDGTFYGFGVICIIGTLFIYFIIPETKGKTVQEIQDELSR